LESKGNRSMRLGLENQFRTRRQRTRVSDMDQTCVSPYGPAAYEKPQSEAGHTTAPDHMTKPTKKRLAFPGASTHVLLWLAWLDVLHMNAMGFSRCLEHSIDIFRVIFSPNEL
jgi:hypothetical protein